MAEPADSSWVLEDSSNIIQTQYFTEFAEESPGRFGTITNKLFKPSMEQITGDGKTLQVELNPGDTVRFSTDALGSFAAPDVFQATTLRVRFNRTTPASNDFSRISASCQTNDIDVENAGKGAIVDFVERMQRQIFPEYDEKLAVHRHLPRSAAICTISGTVKQNDRYYYKDASSTATNTTGARFVIAGGSISAFRAGTRIDVYNGSTLVAGNIAVTDSNPSDLSIGVAYISATGNNPVRQSTGGTGAIAALASGYTIYYSGERNAGMYSLGAYFSSPASTGDSFMGGVDRNSSGYRWMVPVTTRAGETSAVFTKSMLDDLGIAMGFRQEDQVAAVFTTDPTLHQKIRNEYTEAAFLNIPDGDNRLNRFANFGTQGLNYQHPVFGMVKIMADPLHPSNTLRVIVPETWRALYYGYRGLKMMPGIKGGWYRITDTTPNTGDSMFWKMDFYANQTDFCFKPWKNGQILNISAS
jgi:hypothetical protein